MGFYFQNNISGCGYSGEAVDEGDSWVSFPRAGFAGHPSKDPIRLDKRSGRISWGAGPAYASPKAMTRAALGWF